MINQGPIFPESPTTPRRRFRLGEIILILILMGIVASIIYYNSDLPHYFHTHPQYNGKVTITEVSYKNLKGMEKVGNTLVVKKSSVQDSISNLSPNTYKDQLGNIYKMVEEQHYAPFQREICKIYKIEGNKSLLVKNLPDALWCDKMVTDYQGNWFVSGMTHDGGNTSDIYKIEDTKGLYISEFEPMEMVKLFYNEEEESWYATTGMFANPPIYKVTFTP